MSRSWPSDVLTLTAIKPTFTSAAGAAINVGEPWIAAKRIATRSFAR